MTGDAGGPAPPSHASAPPLHIGVSACFMHPDATRPVFKGKTLLYAEESMLRWIAGAGGLPLMVPPPAGALGARDIVRSLDGLVLQGGADVAPSSYGEEPARPEWGGDAIRDAYEIALIRLCLEEDRPVLGICRGLQVLNVALGGSLYQDLATFHPERRVHRSWDVYDKLGHEIAVEPGSALERWSGRDSDHGAIARVNSVHHQGIKELGRGLVIEARSIPDGVIEAIRYAPTGTQGSDRRAPFAYGLQWHPEFMQDVAPDAPPDAPARPLLDARGVLAAFIEEVRQRRAARTLRP